MTFLKTKFDEDLKYFDFHFFDEIEIFHAIW